MNQSKLENKQIKRGKTRASKSWLVWVLPLIGRESDASFFFNQSQSGESEIKEKRELPFDTRLKTTLSTE